MSYPLRFVEFVKNKDKTFSQKSISNLGHLYLEIRFFELFQRRVKKRDLRGNLRVRTLKFRGLGPPKKDKKMTLPRV